MWVLSGKSVATDDMTEVVNTIYLTRVEVLVSYAYLRME